MDKKQIIITVVVLFLVFLIVKRGLEVRSEENQLPANTNYQTTSKIPMNEETYAWPTRVGCTAITIKKYATAGDTEPTATVVLDTQSDIDALFNELEKLHPQGGGLMVSFDTTVPLTEIEFSYADGKKDSVSLYNNMIKTRDTSFYTADEDEAKSTIFVEYVHSLIK